MNVGMYVSTRDPQLFDLKQKQQPNDKLYDDPQAEFRILTTMQKWETVFY